MHVSNEVERQGKANKSTTPRTALSFQGALGGTRTNDALQSRRALCIPTELPGQISFTQHNTKANQTSNLFSMAQYTLTQYVGGKYCIPPKKPNSKLSLCSISVWFLYLCGHNWYKFSLFSTELHWNCAGTQEHTHKWVQCEYCHRWFHCVCVRAWSHVHRFKCMFCWSTELHSAQAPYRSVAPLPPR